MSKRASIVLWTLGIVVVIFLAWHIFISITVRQHLDEQIVQLSNTVTISYEKCHINPFNQQVTLHNLVITTIEGQKEFVIEKLIWKENYIGVQGLIIDIDKEDSRADYIRKLGYHGKIPIDLSLWTEWSSGDSLSARIGIAVPDVGILNIVGNFSRVHIHKDNFLQLSTYATIMVKKLSLIYRDKSYVARALKDAARQKEITVDEKKREIGKIFDTIASNTPHAFQQKSLHALKKFIEKPDTISLYIQPDRPQSIKEILAHIRDINYISNILHAKIATKE